MDDTRYNPNHDPDTGEFSSGGGSGGASASDKATSKKIGAASDSKHVGSSTKLGSGYSKDAKLEDGVIKTSNVNDAVRALYEGRKVELKQPRQVATLVDKLGKITADMVKKGEKAPVFDLCNVSVKGSNLFCAESKGIPRVKMPQLDREQTKKFIKYLKNEGYATQKTRELSDHLRATQNQLDGAKVATVVKKITDNPDKKKRLIVSRDNYILDGHHHWAADIYQAAKADDLFEHETKITRVDIDIITLLEEADKFTGGKGKKGVGAEDRMFDPHVAFFVRGETDAMDGCGCEGSHQEGGHAGEAGEVGEDCQCGA